MKKKLITDAYSNIKNNLNSNRKRNSNVLSPKNKTNYDKIILKNNQFLKTNN